MGGPGGHVPPQVLGYQLTLFGPRGADYARYITTCPPIFLGDAAFLISTYLQKLGCDEITILDLATFSLKKCIYYYSFCNHFMWALQEFQRFLPSIFDIFCC